MIGTIRDITERKMADAERRSEKEFTDSALDAQLDTFFLFEPSTGKAVRWNQSFKDITGYTDKEIAKLSAPARVTVTGRKDKWLAIMPPAASPLIRSSNFSRSSHSLP